MNNKQQLLEHWTRHPDLFMEDMLGIKLPYYQRVILRLMNLNKRLRNKDPIKYCNHWNRCCATDTWLCNVDTCEYRKVMANE